MEIIPLLHLPPLLLLFCMFILGACIGSFLNVVITRLPVEMQYIQNDALAEVLKEKGFKYLVDENPEKQDLIGQNTTKNIPRLFKARSVCLSCEKQLTWYDNIPIASYLMLKGRCRYCQEKINARYLLVELLTAFLFCITAWQYRLDITVFKSDMVFVSLLALFSVLICLTFIDAKHKLLPDELTLPFVWIGLLVNLNTGIVNLKYAVLGAVVGYMTLWLIFQVHYFLTKREGLGYGDFKLTALIGAWFGVYALPLVLLIASVLGIIYYIVNRIFYQKVKKTQEAASAQEIPFGPFLATATIFYGLFIALKGGYSIM